MSNKIKTYDEWKQDKYAESLQWRDWKTCDYLIDNEDAIRFGYEAALVQLNQNTWGNIEVYPDGAKFER